MFQESDCGVIIEDTGHVEDQRREKSEVRD